MLYKVLYTHQKTKKHKTWQDGYLQMLSNGQKAVLLSDEKKQLDSLYVGRKELTVGVSLESDKYLIEIDAVYVFSDKVNEETLMQKAKSELPRNIQSVAVRRQGTGTQINRRKDFNPPFMGKRPFHMSTVQRHIVSTDQNECTSHNQLYPAHACLSFGSNHQSTNKSGLGNEKIRSKSTSNMLCIKDNTEIQRLGSEALFYDPFSSYENESRSRFNDYRGISDSRKVSNEAEEDLKISNAGNINEVNPNIVVEEEMRCTSQRRSTNRILALFSKWPNASSSSADNTSIIDRGNQSAFSNYELERIREVDGSTHGNTSLLDDDYLDSVDSTRNSVIQIVSPSKELLVNGAVSSKIVRRSLQGQSMATPTDAYAELYGDDKVVPDKSSSGKMSIDTHETHGTYDNEMDTQRRSIGIKRKSTNRYRDFSKATFQPLEPMSKPVKQTNLSHSDLTRRLENRKLINTGLLFPSLDVCEASPLPPRMIKIPVEFKNFIEYKTIFKSALIEHLNIILFDLAKKYHTASRKVHINISCVSSDKSQESSLQGPFCCHGACSMQMVKKDGPTKGKLFYCCPNSGPDQCKFFMWIDDYQRKACERGNKKDVNGKVMLSNSNCASSFFNGQGVAFYCGCTFVRKRKDIYSKNPRHSKWGRSKLYMTDDDDVNDKKSIFLNLPFKSSSSSYSKDDIWIVSKNFTFDPGSTFIAKSSFYGPNSSRDVEISAISSYFPSKWRSGETVHAILACNAGMEMRCIENLDTINAINDIPILRHLLTRSAAHRSSHAALKRPFSCPSAATAVSDLLNIDKVDLNYMVNEAIVKFSLNEDQGLVLRNIANMVAYNSDNNGDDCHITLVHGVFGAGKSFLLAVVILFLVETFEKTVNGNQNTGWKILISSTTNVAVDRVLQGLLDLKFEDFVRVGSVKKIGKEVLPYSVHSSGTDSQELRELQSMLKSDLSSRERALVRKSIEKHRLGLNRKKLREAPVVGVTCAASVFPCLENLSFKVHLLDECSQMTEPLSMLPIARFRCEKLVLVGDPKQLSPTIQGSDSSTTNGLDKTLYDRLTQKGIQPMMLRTQYRCHPMISAIPNVLFYKGELRNGIDEKERPPLQDWLDPLCFFNVSNGKEKCGMDGSFYNIEEAEFAVYLITAMLLCGNDPAHIGVITQYKSQVQKISSLLFEHGASSSNHELKSVQISTVDAFQGAEKEIIILSCVRTDYVGFIDCERRTNVALTRAKRHLLILGNLKMLIQNSLWCKIIECCSRHDEGITSAKIFREKIEPIISEKRDLQEQMLKNSSKNSKKKDTKKKRGLVDANSHGEGSDYESYAQKGVNGFATEDAMGSILAADCETVSYIAETESERTGFEETNEQHNLDISSTFDNMLESNPY